MADKTALYQHLLLPPKCAIIGWVIRICQWNKKHRGRRIRICLPDFPKEAPSVFATIA